MIAIFGSERTGWGDKFTGNFLYLMHLRLYSTLVLGSLHPVNVCSKGTPVQVENEILESRAYDYEACLQAAMSNGNLPVIDFLFQSGFHEFDSDHVIRMAEQPKRLTEKSMAVLKAACEYRVHFEKFVAHDIEQDFIWASLFGSIRTLRGYLRDEEAMERLQRQAGSLGERLVERARRDGVLPRPATLYYLSNEPYYEDVMKSAELLVVVAERAVKENTTAHISYSHVLEHLLMKPWTRELGLTLEQMTKLYASLASM